MSAAFLENAKEAAELLRFWKACLMAEEALGKSLAPISPSVARIEGRPYFKVPLADLDQEGPARDFFARTAELWLKPVTEEEEPFLLFDQKKTKELKRFRVDTERGYMAGFPSLLHRDRFGKERLVPLFKFPLTKLETPKAVVPNSLSPKGEIKLLQEAFSPKKGDLCYWLDEMFLSEELSIQEEKIQELRKALLAKRHDWLEFLTLAAATLFRHVLNEERPFGSFQEGLSIYLTELQRSEGKRLSVYPVGLVYELEENQPTKQLQTDLEQIQEEELIEELDRDHPARRFLYGNGPAKQEPRHFFAQFSPYPLTTSQSEALQGILGGRMSLVEGPPGTGKTHLIRNLLGQRLVDFVIGLTDTESRAYDLNHLTLVLSTNNRAVDNALEGMESEGLLPVTLRLGSRIVMMKSSLPFLKDYAAKLEEVSVRQSKKDFTEARAELMKLIGPALEKTPEPKIREEIYLLARRVHSAWVGANKHKLLDLIEELCDEIEEKRGLKSIKYQKNLQFLLSAFPLVGCTLLSVRNLFELEQGSLGMTVIDEAGQCAPSYLFPVLFRAKQAVILGDAKQLEPVTRLREAEILGILASRKVRLERQKALFFTPSGDNPRSGQEIAQAMGGEHYGLKEHFRCHREIIGVSQELCGYELSIQTQLEGPALFFREVDTPEEGYGGSWFNPGEVAACMDLLRGLLAEGYQPGEIALLTPFRGQLQHLNLALRQARIPHLVGEDGQGGLERVTTGTVHRFQGGERKVVIFSPVIAQGEPRFLNSRVNLLNVALSRAMERFLLVGSLAALERGPYTRVLAQRLSASGHRI